MSTLKRQIGIYTAARVLPSIMTFSFTIVCVQSMTIGEYGIYSLMLLPVMLTTSFASSMVGQPMLRYGASLKNQERIKGIRQIPLSINSLILPLLLIYSYIADWPATSIAISLALVLVSVVLDAMRSYFIAMDSAANVFKIDAMRSILSLVFLIILFKTELATSWLPLLAMLCAASVTLFFTAINFKNNNNEGHHNIDRNYLRYGFWVGSWMFVIVLIQIMEREIINWQFGIDKTGLYSSIADPIAMIMSAAGSVIANTLMPRFIEAWNAKNHLIIRSMSFASIISIIFIAAICFAVGVFIVFMDLGHWSELLGSNILLSLLLLIGIGLWQSGIFIHKPLELREKTALMFACVFAAAIIFFISALALIKIFGVLGVALAKILSGVFYIIIVMKINLRNRSNHA